MNPPSHAAFLTRRRTTRRALAWTSILAACGLLMPAPVKAAAGATATDIGGLGGGGTLALGVNDQGAVVGRSSTGERQTRAFLWQNNRMQDIGADIARDSDEGAFWSEATGVNNSGRVVGSFVVAPEFAAQGKWRSFIWERGMATKLNLPAGNSMGFAINDPGQVAGWYWGSQAEHLYRWDRGTTNEVVAGSSFGGMNNSGDVTGAMTTADRSVHAFIWRDGQAADLGTLPGDTGSRAFGVNDRGQVVGVSQGPNGSSVFVWDGAAMTKLVIDCIQGIGADRRAATTVTSVGPAGINNKGHVAGTCNYRSADGTGPDSLGVVWADGKLTFLPPLAGDRNTSARALNNTGNVVGTSADQGGAGHGALWTIKQ
jgi:probable HAF family extracellular repeat protein